MGNLSFDVTREELIEAFSAAGRVVDAKVPTDRETGRPRGFAFVEFESDEAAQKFDRADERARPQGPRAARERGREPAAPAGGRARRRVLARLAAAAGSRGPAAPAAAAASRAPVAAAAASRGPAGGGFRPGAPQRLPAARGDRDPPRAALPPEARVEAGAEDQPQASASTTTSRGDDAGSELSESRGGPTPRTTVRRLPERGRYDRDTIHAILDEGLVCHVGFVDEGQPFVIPTAYARSATTLVIHGSAASRMVKALAARALRAA